MKLEGNPEEISSVALLSPACFVLFLGDLTLNSEPKANSRALQERSTLGLGRRLTEDYVLFLGDLTLTSEPKENSRA
jgi:hypothetical protein